MFSNNNAESEKQLKSVLSQLTSVVKRMDLMEAALNSDKGAAGLMDPEELSRLVTKVDRLGDSLKATMKSTIQTFDAVKDAHSRTEQALRDFSERIKKLEKLTNELD